MNKNKPDSVKMKEMLTKLIDAITKSTDRVDVEVLIDHFVSVRMHEQLDMTCESDADDEYSASDPELFRGDIERAELALAE